eukprot:TRINITY_DN14131_c0_g1_i1.p1 TRINITY_DN14131_c0_g1~~TRINITY_DN14131_c0_g1_i1.p1  ORF type:complete len:191 (-),score=8.22 TRINITY_DN14131_c0_g1_i1:123-695(-)
MEGIGLLAKAALLLDQERAGSHSASQSGDGRENTHPNGRLPPDKQPAPEVDEQSHKSVWGRTNTGLPATPGVVAATREHRVQALEQRLRRAQNVPSLRRCVLRTGKVQMAKHGRGALLVVYSPDTRSVYKQGYVDLNGLSSIGGRDLKDAAAMLPPDACVLIMAVRSRPGQWSPARYTVVRACREDCGKI